MTDPSHKHDPQGEFDERLGKLNRLRDAGQDPYPAVAKRTHTVAELKASFDDLAQAATAVTITGRLRSKRTHGNLSFADLEDASGRIQIAVSKKELTDAENYKPFVKRIDMSDFVEVMGTLFVTKAGEQTLMVHAWRLLTKALRNLPTDHFGFKDEDERYRKRYIDLALQPEERARFVRRAKFWQVMRRVLEDSGFVEVETPSLELTTGGAEARPFITHHNDYDIDVYLRISIGELWQKRLMAAGFEKTYEIGRAFRNEGTSQNHLQEFSNMEFYWAYANYRDGMAFVTELYRTLAQEVYGTTTFTTRGHTFDLADEWTEVDYADDIQKQTDVDVFTASTETIRAKLDELDVVYDATTRERLIDNLWKYCRKNISGPAFLVGHPSFMAPLAKCMKDHPEKVEKFQVLLGGAEVGSGYSELNDPFDQRARFEQQQKLLDHGDEEAMMPDWDFVEMLEYGMPPTCGFGAGERLFAFLEDTTLREATLFPLMKQRSEPSSGHTVKSTEAPK